MISTQALLALWLLLGSVLAQDDDDGTLVQLDKGRIRGIIRKSENGNDYYAFQEIPYAAPPIGASRYQLPKEPEAWTDILNTTRNTKICLQADSRYDLEMTEDCLYINVYTPVKPGTSDDLLPVLLWIHGGAFTAESGTYEYFGPKYIMDHGVVVVSFNYRLGIFGFLGTDDGVIPKNLGLKDQRFAIEWVSKNIHLFGGDPGHITLAGESAGSFSVGLHLISQKPHENLFHAVILQSGTPISNILRVNNSNEQSFRLGRILDSSFSSSNSTELLTILQKANALDIMDLSNDSGIGVMSSTIESEGLFSLLPYQTFIDKNYKKVPVIIGFDSEEWLWLVLNKNETLIKEIDADSSLLVNEKANMSSENRSVAGQLIKELYVGNDTFLNHYGGYIRYITDSYFTTGESKQVELTSDDVPYYFYQFAYKGPLGEWMDILPPPGCEKVVHGEELHYMWDDTINSDLSQFPEADGLMLHRFVKMWTNFVKYFNPTPEEDPLLDNVIWPRSNPTTLRYLNMNVTFDIREQPRQYPQMKAILDKYMQPPFESYS